MIGFHESLSNCVENIKLLNTNCVQVFTRSPRQYGSLSKYDNSLIDFLNNNKIKVLTHAVYFISLLTLTTTDDVNKRTINILNDDIDFLKKVNGIGTVIHVGSVKKSKYTPNQIILKYMEKVNDSTKLIFENKAMAGKQYLYNNDEIISLHNFLKDNGYKANFCFDTCHDFISSYKMSHNKVGKKWEKKLYCKTKKTDDNLQELLNAGVNISCVHLNDSTSYTKDVHADLFTGLISEDVIKNVYKICEKNKIPMIIERMNANINTKKKMLTDLLL